MADLFGMLQAAAGNAGEDTDPNFNQTVLLLHGDGTNGAQNNTFLDSSTNNFTITRNGNTTQGTFSPFSAPDGRWGVHFDGDPSTFLNLNNQLAFGTNDFTFEVWVYLTNLSATNFIIDYRTSGNGAYFTVFVASTGLTNLYVDGATQILADDAIALNTWAHICIERSSGTTTMYINGVAQSTTWSDSTNYLTQSFRPRIGEIGLAADFPFFGYMSNMRAVVGSTVYNGAFTPRTSPLTAVSGTELLTCQSNRFVDNSTNNFVVGRNGNVKVTPFSPFAPTAAYDASVNGGSGYFDGSGDYLSIADAAGLRFGTGNFTIQCWIYRNAAGAVHSIAAKGGASTGWVFQVHSNNKLRFTHTTTNIDSTGTIRAGAWNHVAVVREGTGTNQVKLYINGVNDGQGTVSTDFNQTEQLNIGANRGNSSVMNGYIAGLKYVVGTAETITVPTAPPTGGTALLNFTNAGIFDNTGKNNLETVGNAQIDTSEKKYGTGSIEFDGTGDYLRFPSTPDTAVGDGNLTIEGWVYTNDTSAGQIILERRAALARRGLQIGIDASAQLFTNAGDTDTGSWNVEIAGGTISNSTWYHFAFVRSGSTWRAFLDGTQIGSDTTWTGIVADDTANWIIGSRIDGASYLNGYIDDLRITKGVARYTTTFTPPTKEFPNL